MGQGQVLVIYGMYPYDSVQFFGLRDILVGQGPVLVI